MKRFLSALLCCALLLCIAGCTQSTEFAEPVQFYYPRTADSITYGSPDSVITYELREASGHTEDYLYLLNVYLRGPVNAGLDQPFPKGVVPVSLEQEKGIATLVLSDAFASLSGMDLTLACACLAKTVGGMTDAIVVNISTESKQLNGSAQISIRVDRLLILDSSASTVPTE